MQMGHQKHRIVHMPRRCHEVHLLVHVMFAKQASMHKKQPNIVFAGSPAAILARQQKLAGTARRQLQMNHFASPVPARLNAPKAELLSGLQVQSRPDDKQSQTTQRMEPPSTGQADAHSENGEIFPAAVPEAAEEAAASVGLTDAEPDSAVGSTAITDTSSRQVAAENHAAGWGLAQAVTAAAMTVADAESAATSANDQLGADQSVGATIQNAAASVAAAAHDDREIMPAAQLSYDEASKL